MSDERRPSALQRITEEALEMHTAAPRDAAAKLTEGWAHLEDSPEDVEAFSRALEHVLLGHLADRLAFGDALRRLEASPSEVAQAAGARGRLALKLFEHPGAVHPGEVPPDEQVRAHYNAALAHTRPGRWDMVRQLADRAASAVSADPKTLRAYAAVANNIAADIRFHFQPEHRTDPQRVRTMIDAAERARQAWGQVGGWLEIERAEYQLALCHAAAGQGEEAVQHARECLALCEANHADDFERFFAYEALATAHHAAGQIPEAHDAWQRMSAMMSGIRETEACQMAEGTLEAVSRLLNPDTQPLPAS
jgi:tetratricopeptide (TPR) repeat protein